MTDLRDVRTFPSLVKYLRDELDWPIESDDFDDITFDWEPEELGIDSAHAAKIQQIKQLRPLAHGQPFGIFFVKFEPKRLPVVALRRILGQVTLKKRATANAAERAAWAADDLLFISNYGEGEARLITFAHFSQPEERTDLPTLKVLGWNNLDTALHLDDVADTLTTKLKWPASTLDPDKWREDWRSAFTLRHREVVSTSRELSVRLAELARNIRDRIKTALAIETEHGPLTKLMTAFQETLVHDLDVDGFADMYAQTIAYGLLSARISNPHSKTADDFASHMQTNPFLKELMETFLRVGGRRRKAGGTGIDFDELGVSDVVDLLDDANMEAVVRDFGDQNPQEDPVIHFYELFLKEYDAKKRMQRGVFYTPRPVVSYIVRSVDELLRTEFGLTDGLADISTWGEMAKRHKGLQIPQGVSPDQAFVQILDPATGTGTFLVEVIDLIHRNLTEGWRAQGHGQKKIDAFWNEYVPNHLLPRLHGYELLMAPYAIAHLKIGLKLYETGYRFSSDERVRVYLANSLEPAQDFSGTFEFAIPALAHEAQAVNDVKRNRRFTVVIGNPPYAIGSDNRAPWILSLLADYKKDLNERKLNLDDDYIKFLRLGEHLTQHAGSGVLGMITNNSFTDGLVHRTMRGHLLTTYPRFDVVDLHGSTVRRERSPAGGEDNNVFDIQQGVSLSLAWRGPNSEPSQVRHGELWGPREGKYHTLMAAAPLALATAELAPNEPYWFLVPKDLSKEIEAEYLPWPRVSDIFLVKDTGIQTKRDALTIHFDRDAIWQAVQFAANATPARLIETFALQEDGRDWTAEWAIKDVRESGPSEKNVRRINYRPFDFRWTYYTGKTKGFIAYPRVATQHHLTGCRNVALICTRQYAAHSHFVLFCTRDLTEMSSQPYASYVVHPLYLSESAAGLVSDESSRPLNLSRGFLDGCHRRWAGVTPEDIFHYAYAVLHSPGFRTRYAEFLKIDFPRLPLTENVDMFRDLSRLGGELVGLHLMESPTLDRFITAYTGQKNPEVERVGWSDDTVWLDAAATKKGQPASPGTIGFRGVPEAVWNFHIGGYQVCDKWLKDRKGRKLSKDDIAHYQKIVVALSETIRLMKEIDEVIEEHGAWPGAFAAASSEARHNAFRKFDVA